VPHVQVIALLKEAQGPRGVQAGNVALVLVPELDRIGDQPVKLGDDRICISVLDQL